MIFGWFFKRSMSVAEDAYLETLATGEAIAISLESDFTESRIDAVAQTANDLAERFEYAIDVLEMRIGDLNAHEHSELSRDLLSIMGSIHEPSPSNLVNQYLQDMKYAAAVFWWLHNMRMLSVAGPEEHRAAAHIVATRITSALRHHFSEPADLA